VRATTALAILGLFLAPGIAAAQAPAGTAPSTPSSTMSPPPGTLQAPPATTATTKPLATAPTSHRTTATFAKYKTEADAKGPCGSDPIVWANTSSKVLHASGDKYYGHTRHGAYVCQSAAQKAGYHAAK
jgi:hypothetical protein